MTKNFDIKCLAIGAVVGAILTTVVVNISKSETTNIQQTVVAKDRVPPKCGNEEIDKATIDFIQKDFQELNDEEIAKTKKKSKLEMDWKEDLGILAGTKTRVCQGGMLYYNKQKKKYTFRAPAGGGDWNFMYYYDTDGKLVVKEWEKGHEN
jgi:hypothetical protein